MQFTELILPIILYGILWGAFHYWDYSKTIQKVITNPEKYSNFTILLCKRLTPFPKIIISFLTALLVLFLVIGIINLISFLWSLLT
jgi:hypothetical protein